MLNHPAATHPDLVVGAATSDDAGVLLLPGSDGRALVQTVDFFTPIVDDPVAWGRIGAANALSDIYAMGAKPVSALQLLGWPRDVLPFDVAGEVIRGGADVMAEAGCVIVGGHSIDDAEPTYGFAVTGIIDIADVITNAGAQVGDRLVLTKPLGSGVVTTAIKAGVCPPTVLDEMVEVMAALNDVAGSALKPLGAHAATDVTGFGLLGHLTEMLVGAHVGAVINVESVPVVAGVVELLAAGNFPGGSKRNVAAVESRVDGREESVRLLADAQTSGGLLVALTADAATAYMEAVPGATEIGEITDQVGRIRLE